MKVFPLLILGIMLSNGTPRQKSKLLFELYDPDDTKVVRVEKFEQMTDIILDLSLIYLPSLVSNETKPLTTENKVREYCNALVSHRDSVKEIILDKFIGPRRKYIETITQREFMVNFDVEETAKLTTPYAIRILALECNYKFYLSISNEENRSTGDEVLV